MVNITGPEGPAVDDAINKIRNKNKNSDDKTTAAAPPSKKIKSALDSVDINRTSEIFKNFINQTEKISNLLNFSNSSGAGGSDSTPSSGVSNILINALTGALAILVRKYGYERVILFLESFLNDQTFLILPETYQNIVKESIINLFIAVSIYGEDNIPISILPEIIYGDVVPETVVVDVPDLYVKQYFIKESDPYPGYIQWVGPENEIIYTLRSEIDYPFESLDEELFSLAEQGLAKALEIYFINEENAITISIFLALLVLFCNKIEEKATDSSVGKNGNNFSIGNLASLLGSIGSNIQNAYTNHIPNSVLDKQKINKLMEKSAKMQGRIHKLIKPASDLAIKKEIGNMTNLLSSLTNLQNSFSSYNNSKLNGLSGPIGDSVQNFVSNLDYLNNLTGVDIRNTISDIDNINITELNSKLNILSATIEDDKISQIIKNIKVS